MSLEAKIAELTIAVQALTHAMKERVTAVQEEPAPEATPLKGGLTHEEYNAPEVKAPNESTSPELGEQSEPEPQTSFTYDDVKRATNALSATKGKEVTIAALAHFGVTRATQLTEAQWGEYIAYCDKAAA